MKRAIGIDVGATKIAAALVGPAGEVVDTRHRPTHPERGSEAVLDDIATLARQLWPQEAATLAGIGIGTPGQVNGETGTVHNAVNLGWKEVPLVAEVQARLQTEIALWVQKDANAAALGEYVFGAARGHDDFVYLSVGSGLGGGIVAGGRLITGAEWNAAEVGHLVLDTAGRRCACGQRGCAETVVSGPGLSHLFDRYRKAGRYATELPAAATNRQIVAAAAEGDELARAALAGVGAGLGEVMAACVALLNPGLIVIGGGLGLAAFEWLLPAACAELRRRVLPGSTRPLTAERSQVESSAVGAAGLVWHYGEGGEAIL